MRNNSREYSRRIWQWSLLFLVCFTTSCHCSTTPPSQETVPYTTGRFVLTAANQTFNFTIPELESSFENVYGNGSCFEAIQMAQSYKTDEAKLPFLVENCSLCCEEFHVKNVLQDWILLSSCGPLASLCLANFTSMKGRVTADIFWLTSSGEDIWVYTGNSTDVVMTWDFLSPSQKALEIIIACCIFGIIIVTVFGNGIVIVTLAGNSNTFDYFWIVRTSLAINDLVRGAFIMTFAFYNTVSLMKNEQNLNEAIYTKLFPFSLNEPLLARNGYATFCAFLFGLTEVMSFQLQSWLAIERLLLIRKSSRESQFSLFQKVKGINCIMWLIGIIFPLLILTTGKYSYFGNFAFDLVTKLPLLLPADTELSLSYSFYWCLQVYLFCLYLITVVLSHKSISLFKAHIKSERAETVRNSTVARAEEQEKENQRILTTMKLMAVLYTIYATPRFGILIPGLKSEARPIYYLCWWIFIVSSSWNWYLFNFRGRFFLDSLARLLLKLPRLPKCLHEMLENLLIPISDSNVEWGSLWYELQTEIEKKKLGISTMS
ncbi:uncharacterized protein [Palaemon carinicauda]|uniref:uncharacterized protein n=1 Tax=Palaemon carinicauda TaxID=392227 RepID=UPI0035B66A92